ncbi:hypothetical protein, partial [Aeromonas jandaei]
KLFLMLDAVSAHTDCLIQIVKERRSFCCCGSGILLNRLLESSLICKGFSRLSTRLFALPLAVSMEAHYRDPDHVGKGKLRIFLRNANKRSDNEHDAHFLNQITYQ